MIKVSLSFTIKINNLNYSSKVLVVYLELEVMTINLLTVCLFRKLIAIWSLVWVIFEIYVVARALRDSISIRVLIVPTSLWRAVFNGPHNLLMSLISESLLSLNVILHIFVCINSDTILNQDVLHHPRNEREAGKESHYLSKTFEYGFQTNHPRWEIRLRESNIESDTELFIMEWVWKLQIWRVIEQLPWIGCGSLRYALESQSVTRVVILCKHALIQWLSC